MRKKDILLVLKVNYPVPMNISYIFCDKIDENESHYLLYKDEKYIGFLIKRLFSSKLIEVDHLELTNYYRYEICIN